MHSFFQSVLYAVYSIFYNHLVNFLIEEQSQKQTTAEEKFSSRQIWNIFKANL